MAGNRGAVFLSVMYRGGREATRFLPPDKSMLLRSYPKK
jgi:hypothetical protein